MINWRNIIEPARLRLTEADSPRLVLCEACGSEGCGRLLDDDDGTCACRYRGASDETISNCRDACPYCEGTGGELIATEPVELEDAMAFDADMQRALEADAEKLSGLTGEDHTVTFISDVLIRAELVESKGSRLIRVGGVYFALDELTQVALAPTPLTSGQSDG